MNFSILMPFLPSFHSANISTIPEYIQYIQCIQYIPYIHTLYPDRTDEGRAALFKINLRDINVSDDVQPEQLASMTDGYSGADITNVCRDAALMVGGGMVIRDLCVDVCIYMCVFVCMYVCMYMFKNVHIYVCMHI